MGVRAAFLLVVPALVAACRSLPEGAPEPPTVQVSSAGAEAPNQLAVTVLPVTEATFLDTLDRAGVGLRVAGEREDMVLRFAELDPAAEYLLLRTFAVPDASFSPPRAFGAGDVIEADTLAGSPPVGFSMHLVARAGADGIEGFDAGVLVRPEDGALLPVLRGRIPVRATGSVLLTGESPGRRPFAAVLRVTLAGTERIASLDPPGHHRVRVRPYTASSPAFARALASAGLPEKGGAAGLAVYRIDPKEREALDRALAEEASEEPESLYLLVSGDTLSLPLGGLTLGITVEFSLADYTYATAIDITSLPDAPRTNVAHGERDALLLLGWDAVSAGRSRALLLTIEPGE